MSDGYILVKQSLNLNGQINLYGAKNAALPILASLILTQGKSTLKNVPNSSDIIQMIKLLHDIGAQTDFDTSTNILHVDTSTIDKCKVNPEVMSKMRASILVTGPLLARFGKAAVATPGGCLIGARPIDFHLKGFKKMGVTVEEADKFLNVSISNNSNSSQTKRIILEYPSVGATENLAMLAVLTPGTTEIVNAALEPEVLDFIQVLQKMGANIKIDSPATMIITGVQKLNPINHTVIPDRLEAGALLLSAAITGGQIYIPGARLDHMDVFLEKLREMGHEVIANQNGISLKATQSPVAVNFKTGPYPGFPTDLQATMMVAQCLADGVSIIEETVFENRLLHTKELAKMGAQIKVEGTKAVVNGVDNLYGTEVIATDIRASCALVLAGLIAKGQTKILGIAHWRRGYDNFEQKLSHLGAQISIEQPEKITCLNC
jgi:UDP-N-acetylglucosamine 1-carboxyvinyltransferase